MPRVLIVDDLETNRFLLEEVVETLGVDVLTAGSGAEALEIVEAELPEVVLLDFQMPGMDGAEAARRIKQRPGAPYTHVVIVSGFADMEQDPTYVESGADGFLGKPFEISALRAVVAEGLERAAARR